jgi:hypothetical protein
VSRHGASRCVKSPDPRSIQHLKNLTLLPLSLDKMVLRTNTESVTTPLWTSCSSGGVLLLPRQRMWQQLWRMADPSFLTDLCQRIYFFYQIPYFLHYGAWYPSLNGTKFLHPSFTTYRIFYISRVGLFITALHRHRAIINLRVRVRVRALDRVLVLARERHGHAHGYGSG